MSNERSNCGWKIHWLFLAVGSTLALMGDLFTATIVGAIVGIPLLLIALPLLRNPAETVACV